MDGIALMASAMHAAQARLDISALNLANVSTDGFRRSIAHAVLTAGGVVTEAALDGKQLALRHTGRVLDIAVAGAGAFLVRGAEGTLYRERSASFERDVAGRLSDGNGRVLLGRAGPMLVGADASLDDRAIRVTPGTVLRSGFLEASNVDAIHEMVDVLTAQRAFETAQKTLSAIDDVRSKATNESARVKS
jgi:flagellar basal-body rod protein FlgF